MFRLFWSSALAISLALALSLALRMLAARWARGREGAERAPRVAALRLGLVLLVVIGALAQLIRASSDFTWPVRWALGAAGALCALPWLANAVAGLWLLSPFFRARPGDAIEACGQRGTLVGFGATRLELRTEAGWTAYLPYAAVAWGPVLIGDPSRARGTRFRIERQDWTDDELQLLREAAILAPYRDLSIPVRLSRRGNVVSVHLGLSRPGAEARMRRFLDAALSRPEARRNDLRLGSEDA